VLTDCSSQLPLRHANRPFTRECYAMLDM
jgi:hypothetical protein